MDYKAIALTLFSKTIEQMEEEKSKYAPEDWAKIIDAMFKMHQAKNSRD